MLKFHVLQFTSDIHSTVKQDSVNSDLKINHLLKLHSFLISVEKMYVFFFNRYLSHWYFAIIFSN
jgi:hypothetical protein